MTRTDADKDAKKLNETTPKWWCPLIKEDCRKDCINFTPAFVQEIENRSKGMLHDINDDNFEVEGFVCSNAMFISDFIMPECGGH